MSSNSASAGSGGCSPRDEAALRTLLLAVDPRPVEARAVAIRLPLSAPTPQRQLRPSCGRLRRKKRCDGVDWGKHTNGLWACQSFGMSSQAAPEFESVHSGRDGPRSRDFSCANDAVVDGRFAQKAAIPTTWRTGSNRPLAGVQDDVQELGFRQPQKARPLGARSFRVFGRDRDQAAGTNRALGLAIAREPLRDVA